jgi:hypothetical protein
LYHSGALLLIDVSGFPRGQVGTTVSCSALPLFLPPRFDSGVIPRKEHLRYSPSPKLGRTRVMRFLQLPVSEGLGRGGLRIAKHSGQETGDPFYRGSRGHFATGQHEVS